MTSRTSTSTLAVFIGVIGLLATIDAKSLAAQDGGCAAIEGVEGLLAAKRVLLFGEIHGTAESPTFVGEVACHALAAGLAVTVALELPQKDQSRVDAFMAIKAEEGNQDQLYSPFWRKSYQDGRTSIAMAKLVEQLRLLGRSNPVDVVLIDRPEARQGRDQVMAAKLAEIVAAAPEGILIALTGNMHNRTVPGAPWNADYQPMGYLLGEMVPELDLLALDVAHTGGTAWACLRDQACQAQQLGGRGTRELRAATLYSSPDERGFHGLYEVGAIHASPPAATEELVVP